MYSPHGGYPQYIQKVGYSPQQRNYYSLQGDYPPQKSTYPSQ